MAGRRSVFYEEWRDCLHSHYLYVLETKDEITEPTLRHVLVEAGVAPELVEAWRMEAAALFGLELASMPASDVNEPPLDDVDVTQAGIDEADLEISTEIVDAESQQQESVIPAEASSDDQSIMAQEDEAPEPPPIIRAQLSLFGDDEQE